MASGPNNIIIQLTDGVDPNISVKIQGIATASIAAAGAIGTVQQALSQLSSQGISSQSLTTLKGTLTSINNQGQILTTTFQAMGNAASQSSGQVDQLSASYATLAVRMGIALGTLQAFTAAANNASSGVLNFNANVGSMGGGLNNAGLSTFQVSSALKTMEGSTMGAGLAAAALIRQSALLSQALQVAFPVIGAFALLEVITMIINKVDEARQHMLAMQADTVKQTLLEQQMGVQKVQGETGFSFSNTLLGRPNIPTETVDNPAEVQREIGLQDQLAAVQATQLTIGKQGVDLQNAKVQGIQNEIALVQQQIAKVQTLHDVITNSMGTGLLNKTVPTNSIEDIITNAFSGAAGGLHPGVSGSGTTAGLFPGDSTQFKTLSGDALDYQHSIEQLQVKLQELQTKAASQSDDPLYALRDAAKAAKAEMQGFTAAMDALKISDAKNNVPQGQALQDQLNLVNQQQSTAMPQNQIKLSTEEATLTQQISKLDQSHAADIQNLISKYENEASAVGLYSNALKEQEQYEKAVLQLQKDKALSTTSPATPQQAAQLQQIQDLIKYSVENAGYQKELGAVYEQANGSAQKYSDTQRALVTLMSESGATTVNVSGQIGGAVTLVSTDMSKAVITAEQYAAGLQKNALAYQAAVDPMAVFQTQLSKQTSLFGLYGQQVQIANQVDQMRSEWLSKNTILTNSQAVAIASQLIEVQNDAEVNKNLNDIYTKNVAIYQTTINQVRALAEAHQSGMLVGNNYNTSLIAIGQSLAQQRLDLGNGQGAQLTYNAAVDTAIQKLTTGKITFDQYSTAISVANQDLQNSRSIMAALTPIQATFLNMLTQSLRGYQGFAIGLTTIFSNTFSTISNGLGRMVGEFATGQETLSQAMQQLASSVISELISSLIKLDIQMMEDYLIAMLLKSALGAIGAGVGGAETPASSGTFGNFSSSGFAVADIPSPALGVSTGGDIQHLALGGFSGTVAGQGSPFFDSVPAMLAPGEFVINAMDAQKNAADLQRINSGGSPNGQGNKISITHDGSTSTRVQQMADGEIRIIARQEAEDAIQRRTEGVMSSALANQNSRTAKTLKRHYNVGPRR